MHPHPSNRSVPASRRRFLHRSAGTLGALGFAGMPVTCTAAKAAGSAAPVGKLRLALSTVMFSDLPIEEVCGRAAQLGFEAIDIWSPFGSCRHLADVAERLGPEGLRQLLSRHKLQLGSFTTYGEGKSGFPAFAEFIGKFGGGVVVRQSEYIRPKPSGTASGAQPGGGGAPAAAVPVPPPQVPDLTTAMRGFFERLKPQIEQAAQMKARLAIENHGHALLDSLDSFKAFVDLNPAPQHVGLAIAPYHLQGAGASVEEAIRIAGSQLLFFYAWQKGEGMSQLPGEGPANFGPWLDALASIRYPGFVNPFMHGHPTPDEMSAALRKSCTYLAGCASR